MNGRVSAKHMGGLDSGGHGLQGSLLVVLLLLVSGWSGMASLQPDEISELSPEKVFWVEARTSGGDVDVPSWRVNDLWTYDGYMDVAALLANNGVSSNIQTLTGDLDMWVEDILFMTVENQSTLVYKVRSHALFEANGVSLDGNNGNLDVDYDQTDFIRVSDLATIEMTMDIDVTFTVWGFVNIDIGQMIITNEYSPPREQYDFPLRVGETWTNNYTNTLTWAGASDYFTIPDDSVNQGLSGHGVVAYGDPNVPYGTGCAGSYNVTSYDSNGTPDGFQWYCPAVGNDAWRHIEIEMGLEIDFKLKSITPVQRSTNIDVDLDYPIWIPNANLSAWVNVTDSNGNPLSGQTVQFRYECIGYSTSLTTAANGSAHVVFFTGSALDPSPTTTDYASHGVIAWMSGSKKVGVDTITLDDQLALLDYLPRPIGVSVDRTRDGHTVSLNPVIGYTAIPGDSLEFSVPVLNKGIFAGPASTLEVTAPDGTTSRAPVPALASQAEALVSITWNVPPTQPVGDVSIIFEVDPDGFMTDDANQSNDIGEFEMFIGRLPEANLIQPPATKTMTTIPLDARNSIDPDGGSPHCTFVVEVDVATNETFEEEDCLLENSWDDDGQYHVWLTVTDDENDQDFAQITVTILNRAPWVNITSPKPSIAVESTITFDAHDSGDLDTRNSDAPVDLLWQPPSRSDGTSYECEQGLVGMECTVTPLEEGMFRIQVTVEDDDFATTSNWFDLMVTNIAPSDARITMWRGEEEVIDESNRTPPIWKVFEDEPIILRGDAHDSLNDMDSLSWGWQPDLDIDPNWYLETVGPSSEIQVTWQESGGHIIAMEVIDDDGLSSGVVNGWIEVKNVAPTVEPFGLPMMIAEDEPVELTGVYSDTSSDLDSLRVCWDIDFMVDSDENGDFMDDCDYEGANLAHAWAVHGEHKVRFHVTDDDGEQAEAIVNVSVINRAPKAKAEAEHLTVKVGEEIVIWTNGTSDSASDMANLRFEWDLDTSSDWDDDGDPANDIELTTEINQPLRHVFLTAGTKNIRLRVSDESTTSTVDLIIVVELDEKSLLGGWFDKNTAGVSNYVIILGLVLVALLGVLAFTTMRRGGRPQGEDWLSGGALFEETPLTSAPPTHAFEGPQDAQQDAAPALLDNALQPVGGGVEGTIDGEQTTSEAAAPLADSPDAPTGPPPPIPAEGLPPGWTQEQWEWYGHEWLEEQSQAPPGLADGLDFDL